jgi:hypothetical protein
MADKRVCPITKDEFLAKAAPVAIKVNGQTVTLDPRTFSTGSFGWYFSGKVSIEIDGKPVAVQCGLNLTVVGSKLEK